LQIDPNIELPGSITQRSALIHFRTVILWLPAAIALACSQEPSAPEPPPEIPSSIWVEIGDELFELELAIDDATRHQGLSGRPEIAANGGMLFVSATERPQAMVMRDCAIPIDVAFLDFSGVVVAIHEMRPELPRRPAESAREYESRLQVYSSVVPAGFAIETAGGRLGEADVKLGDSVVFDIASTLDFARRIGAE
jgi:uncharacterized membrane protein (UPF0127 family)